MRCTFELKRFLRHCGFLVALSFFTQAVALSQELYFPPIDGEEWERVDPSDLGWNMKGLDELLAALPENGTRSFIILKDGKIAVEKYWGAKLTGLGDMDANSMWYWASAGKTLTSVLVGIAQDERLLKIKEPVSKYLDERWTSVPEKSEKKIKIFHQLSMSTGLDERIEDPEDITPESLKFFAPVGTRWAYHNAPYTLLTKALEKATAQNLETYYKQKLGTGIGMKGIWQMTDGNLLFFSDARSMSRLGLLLLNNGTWASTKVLSQKYIQSMISPSQKDNPSYGYLTWLNRGQGYKLPRQQIKNKGKLIPSAPDDLFMAVGKNGQLLMVVPSKGLVIVRQGMHSNDSFVPQPLIRNIWDKLTPVIN